jgi:hypothetical protein
MTGFFQFKKPLSTELSSQSDKGSTTESPQQTPLRRPTRSSDSKDFSPFSTPEIKRLSKPEKPKRPERYLCFDLENRPLAYWYDGETTSEITAFGWKWSDEDVVYTMLLTREGTFQWDRSDDSESVWFKDKGAYLHFCDELKKADVVYGHNIRRHDLPMLNASLLRRQLPLLPSLVTSDTLKDYPRRKGLSASLENLAAMYGLEGEKKIMRQPDWETANRLSPDGMELARERVASDVLLQESLRKKLIELNLLKPSRRWNP